MPDITPSDEVMGRLRGLSRRYGFGLALSRRSGVN